MDHEPAPGPVGRLPLPLTTFIGRGREIAQVQRLLAACRLLTLTGTGGAGKTRLALHVASSLVADYPDGIWLVALEALTEPYLVPRQLATALGVREELGQPLTETVVGYVRSRQALIVLDNCEHVASACGALVEALLRGCPGLRILATSRQPLAIAGETTWRVPSLAIPGSGGRPRLERLREIESVQLFAERAAAALPGFAVTERNAAAVADLCRRLDGIPLALELAAPRVRVLSVEQIVARLDDRFRLLTGGSPTALPRQQTLLGTLDWSYEALGDPERRLLRRLSVFAGGWRLEAAEAVCAGDGIAPGEVLHCLAQLVDKSLVSVDDQVTDAVRYRLLETIRHYGADKLGAAGEATTVRRQHARWALSLAESLGRETTGPHQAAALERLMPELDNLRTALDWALHDAASVEAGLRACVAAYRLWLVYGLLGEGRQRLVQLARTVSGGPPDAWRASAFLFAATLAMFQGDYAGGRSLVEESLALARATGNNFQVGEALSVLALLRLNQGDPAQSWAIIQEDLALCRRRIERPEDDDGPHGNALASALYGPDWPRLVLGRVLLIAGVGARVRGNPARAVEFYEESLALIRQQGDIWFIGQVLSNLGLASLDQGDRARARELFEEALALRRALGDRTGIARSLNDLGSVAYAEDNLVTAQECYGEELTIVRELGDRSGIADALVALGQVARARGDRHQARVFSAESLTIRQELGHRLAMPMALDDLAELAAADGHAVRALRLAGAAAALRQAVGSAAPSPGRRGPEAAHRLLDAAASAAAWDEGRAMTEDQALAYALAEPTREPRPPSRGADPGRASHAPLSERELSVARLIALGRTNRQIALELVIAEGTADRHVSNILGKLGLGTRAQVALWAAERGLVSSAGNVAHSS